MGEKWHTAKYSILTGLYLAKRAHSEGNYETRAKFVTEFKSRYKMYGSDITYVNGLFIYASCVVDCYNDTLKRDFRCQKRTRTE